MPLKLDPKIRAAVERNHGGFDKADDAAVRRLWDSLDKQTQQRYLAPTPDAPKKVVENDRTRPTGNG
jgi:hypothetical protein